jgi:hypothetical protein
LRPEGVEVSHVYRERKKNLVQLIQFNPVQQASSSRLEKKNLFCILMSKSGL